MIITPLKEFLPQPERDRFIDWLKENSSAIHNSLEQRRGILDQQWFKSYSEAMLGDRWDELFLPRYIFGWYITERVEHLLSAARQHNYLQCDLIRGDVYNIQKHSHSYQLEMAASNSSIVAQQVVLAIGSPPNKAAFLDQLATLENSDSTRQHFCCITNMYEPSQNDNLKRVLNFLQQSRQSNPNEARQVVIVGSNASALETLYSFNNYGATTDLIDKFIIISPSGEFPHPIGDDVVEANYEPHYLTTLTVQNQFTAKQILEAVKQDIKAALKQNQTINSIYSKISQRVIEALNQLNYQEQKLFVTKYGVEIGKFQRRAGIDYLNIVDKLVFEGRLQFIKGRFTGTIPLAKNQLGFEFISARGNQTELFTSPIQVLINCAGFQDLTKSDSLLINNLIQSKICVPNDSLGGFEMNENFEASENFYLMGPLVAGNINRKLKVWHAESCGRIFNLSRSLAEVLVQC
ncbi:MAG: FAD/NAD(P)-binding protein [Cyanobacteria bacterium P01_A01_bin.40]